MTPQRNLAIDIGNTSIKVLVFEMDAIIWQKSFSTIKPDLIKAILKKYKPQRSIICSVAKTPASLSSYLQKNTICLELNAKTKLPVKIAYSTPATLGSDRIAGIIGASKLFPQKNVLVIDLGTCIKYDFLTKGMQYIGGSISPGLHMRLKALHHYTDRLPLLKPAVVKGFIGKSTSSSILTGVQIGITAEIEGFVSRYKTQYGLIKVIITGGDTSGFARQLKFPIFAAPDLIGIGLNEILNFNAQN